MNDERRFDELVSRLYEAAVNPDLWRSTLLTAAEWTGAHSFHMFTWDRHDGRPLFAMVSHDHLEERIRLYNAYYHQVDPVLKHALTNTTGGFFASQEFFDDSFVNCSEYYQDFLVSNNQCWVTGGNLQLGDGVDAVLAMVRNHDAGRFDAEELKRARRFWTHYHKATSLFVQTESLRRNAIVGVRGLEQIEIGVVATDGAGRVLFINAQAEAMMKANGRIAVREGRLTASEPSLGDVLRKALERADRGTSSSALPVVARTADEEGLLMTVAPLGDTTPIWSTLARPSVLVLIRSRSRQRMVTAYQLMQLFGLTPAEARVARALAQGQSLEAYATDSAVSLSTARTQLRSVLGKTGTTRQPDLVRLLASIMSIRAST